MEEGLGHYKKIADAFEAGKQRIDMEETKTAEEIYLDSLNLPITNSATRLFWEETLRVFKEQQLTQQQEVNAELKKQNAELIECLNAFRKMDRLDQNQFHLNKIKAIQTILKFQTHHLKIES